jgi:hypothetical protein
MEAVTALVAAHPEVVTAFVLGLLVHLRALVPPAAPGSPLALVLLVWDILAGNYGKAKNVKE